MTQYQGIRLIAKALCLTVTDKTDFVRDLKSNRWWLIGCKEGDQPLPQTGNCYTINDAIDRVSAWLFPEIAVSTKCYHGEDMEG